MNINWDEAFESAENDEYKQIPTGEYAVMIKNTETKPSSSGKPMIRLDLQLTDEGEFKNRVVFLYLVFDPDNGRAIGITFRRLASLGITAEWLKEHKPELPQIAALLEGRTGIAKIKTDTYQGNPSNSVSDIKGDPSAAPITEAPGSVIKSSSPSPTVGNIPSPGVPKLPFS